MGKTKDIISGNQLNETVAQLYSLRAGLSVISERADDIRNYERQIEDERARVKPITSNIEINRNSIKKYEIEIGEKREKIECLRKEIARIQSIDYSTDKLKFKHNFQSRLSNAKMVACIIFGILFTLPGIVNSFIMGADVMPIILLTLGISLLSVAMLYSGLKARKDTKIEQDRIQEAKESNEYMIKQRECQIDGLQNTIKSLIGINANLSVANNNQQAKKEELQIEIESHISEIKSNIVAVAKEASLYNIALENEYTRLLNPADWKNTDLCIFYLQTGRADSIKECLLLADRQRQNDEIVGAIKSAGNRICGEISSGFKALGSTMVACINSLSMQIDAVSSSLTAQHDETIRALGAVENSNAALLSATQLNNALQAKANATNEALLRDYKYVQNRMGIVI